MIRRDMLKAAAAALGGAGLLGARPAALAAAPSGRGVSTVRGAPFVETRDGTLLFLRDWGAGAPVLFLSGWTLPSDVWAYQMIPLSEAGLRCVAYDRRGHGRSSDPGAGYDYDTLADDLAEVLTALDLRDVTLVAHSMAGGEAVRYLSRHGSRRIKRLALLGATLPFMTKSADNPDGIDPAALEQTRRNVFAKGFPTVLHENLRPFVVAETSDATLDWVRSMMLQCSLKAAMDLNRALMSTDFRAELPRLATPTLIVHGDRDASAPFGITAHKTAQLLPNVETRIYEGAPHGLMLTHAARLNQDLLEFIGLARGA
jgi:non-heme chloroperoxidase